jgi:hypothetical protein
VQRQTFKGLQDPQAHKVIKVRRVSKVSLAPQGLKVCKVFKEFKELTAQLAQLDRKEALAQQALREILERHQPLLALLDPLERHQL